MTYLVRHNTLILSCTVSEILQVFVLLTPPVFHTNFGDVSLTRSPIQSNLSRYLKLFGHEIIFSKYSKLCEKHT